MTAEIGSVLTLLGIDANLTAATEFEDANGQPVTLAAFLAAVNPAPSPGGTLVKVQGTFAAGAPDTIVVEEAEIEN